ncbi:MAG: porin family protein [Pelagibacteraceae bacterium]
MINKKPTTGAISLVLFSFFLVSFFLETTSAIMAADTSGSKIIVNGEEILIPGSSEKNITYLQILQKPNDLDLNLKYAQQQGKIGNYKQTIATLERLNMIYPDNVEIKLYLLSVLVQADSPNKALTIIEDIKTSEDLTPEDVETINQIETTLKERGAPKLWNFYADISLGGVSNQNVNSVSKTRLQSSADEVIGFNSAKYDKTYSEGLGLTATRSLGENSSLMINASFTDSEQREETADDFESYGLTIALDTYLGNQSLSPYVMISKTDYQDDADSFSLMQGIGGSFSVGDQNSFSYGYSFSDSKNNKNSTDTTANETNAKGHGLSLGHDYVFNEIISSSTGLGYSTSEAKVGTNDFETYDLNFRLNFALPLGYISVGNGLSFNDYKNVDTSINSNRIRSDVTNTFDLMFTKAIGDFFPTIDPDKSLFISFSYEKIFSEANIINYDYISDSFAVSLSKSFHLNK